MKLYTLLHISEDEKSTHNSFVKDFREQILVYLGCAKNLSGSLERCGIELTILTNNLGYINKISDYAQHMDIRELNFDFKVPSGINFYSAHFKIEVYKYLSNLKDEYVGIVDADILCINQIPLSLVNVILNKIPLYYDLTSQVTPAFGQEVVIHDKEFLGKYKSCGLWAGGELMLGPPSFFDKVYQEISSIKERYFMNFSQLHHQGDEMLLSVAIEKLLMSGEHILDAGSLNIIYRFWNAETMHSQIPVEDIKTKFFIHLPSDKHFISALKKEQIYKGEIYSRYAKHLQLTRIKGRLKKLLLMR